LSCFLKAEKLNVSRKTPKPRIIFPRDPRYNLVLASRLKPFEHWLWAHLTADRVRRLGFRCPGSGRLVAKGLNGSQRAGLIEAKLREGFSCVEVGGAAFEAHVGPSSLKTEHRVYMAAFPGDRTLARLLSCQLRLFGRLPCGARFSREGGRASGDFNTGMGNSLVMLCLVFDVMSDFQDWDCLVDGDNALLFVRTCELSRLMTVVGPRALASCGQELVVERPTSVLEEVVFGQSVPIWFPEGRRLVRSPFKVLSNMFASHVWLREPVFRREYLIGVARCEASLASGLPLVQAACRRLLEVLGDVPVREHIAFRDWVFLGADPNAPFVYVEPDPATRASFEVAFGLSPEAQILAEERLSRMDIPGFGSLYDALEPFEPGAGPAWTGWLG
jgi:hypothetical protein